MTFTKMHGLGNDFLVFEGGDEGCDWSQLAKDLCRRRLSVGADGILVVLPSESADIRMRIINADGSEAEMCGNGIRCFAKYVYERGIVAKRQMTVETLAGVMVPRLELAGNKVTRVTVDMGLPEFERARIPMTGEGSAFDVPITAAGQPVIVSALLMGVPHAVVLVQNIDSLNAAVLGPAIETHPVFPKKTNVDFVQVIDSDNIRMLTWERGAGLTLACGTGSCASVVALHQKGLIGHSAHVHLAAGTLYIEVQEDGRVMMTGPAEEVYTAVLTES